MSTAKPFWWEARKGWYIWVAGEGGKRSRIRLADTKEKAFRIWRDGLKRAAQEKDNPLFLDVAAAWLERQEVRLSRGEVSKTWLSRVCRTVGKFAAAHSGITAREVTPVVAHAWIGKEASANYERTELGAIKQCLRWAADNGLIDKSPLAAMRLPQVESRQTTITREAHETLIHACGDSKFSGPSIRCFRQLLIASWLAGTRPGELRLLRWNQVDTGLGFAKLEQHKTRKKVHKPRVIYFSVCMQTLVRIKQDWQSEKELVFVNARGGAWTKDAVVNRMSRLKEKTGLEAVAYSYRHAFVTRALVSGIDSITVAELVGHSSISMIQRHYAHLDKESQHLIDAVNQVSLRKSD